VPILKRQRSGRIVNVASVSARTGGVMPVSPYAASKAGVVSLTKTFASYLAPFGVNVNAVAPGPVDTDLTRAWSEDQRDRVRRGIPWGRFATAEEIAAVVVRDGEIVELFETLVNPERPIPYFVSQLTNITWDMVKDKPTFDRVAPEVMRVLEGNVFVAHNMMFDWRFVTSELSRSTGRKLQGRRLCTVKIARKVLPQLSRRSLDHVARYYGVEIHGRHRAAGDALATAKCLLRMLSDLGDRGCATWGDLETLLRAPAVRRKKRRASGLPTPVLRDTTA
jgi:DNA polymerase-3 subunit epsilon